MKAPAPILLALADPVLNPPVMPYGVQILASALEAEGLTSDVIWPYLDGDGPTVLKQAVLRQQPAVIGLSFRNLDTAGCHYLDTGEATFLDDLRCMVEAARSVSSVVVVGGSGFSVSPSQILHYIGADAGFVGPSETDFARLCRRLVIDRSSLPEAVQGLPTVFLPGQPAPKPQKVVLLKPSRMQGRAVEYAKLVGGMVPVRTKTGCPLRCIYCVVPSIERLVFRSWEDVQSELRVIVDAGLGDRIFIADGEFNLPWPDRATNMCDRIRNAFGEHVQWRCYLEAGYVTESLVDTLVKSGCIGVSLTVDSFADQPRKGFAKGTPARRAIEGVELCWRAGFRNVLINLLFGGPHETLATAVQTAETAWGFREKGVGVNVTVGLRVYPNTPFARVVMQPEFAGYFQACKSHAWLGMFCSPLPSRELAEYITPIVVPDDRVVYNHTQKRSDMNFYVEVAYGSGLLYRCEFAEAERYFRVLLDRYGQRPELELGLLKAQARLSESGSDSWRPSA